jgi:hypothetical protein
VIIVVVLVGIVVVLAAVLPLTIFVRCRRIDAMRNQKLRDSYAAAISDVNAGDAQPWESHFDANENAPKFDEMVWKLWRPVSSFYEAGRGPAR